MKQVLSLNYSIIDKDTVLDHPSTIFTNDDIDVQVFPSDDLLVDYIAKNTVVSNLSDLPTEGTVYRNKLYNYNGTTVQCIQEHERTIFAPEVTPALFNIIRTDTGDLEWAMNEKVIIGSIRFFNTKKYICIQSHTTLEGWTPDQTPALWQEVVVVPPTGEWAVGVAYKVGDECTYLGITYRVLQAHTSQAGWTPPIVPALFQQL